MSAPADVSILADLPEKVRHELLRHEVAKGRDLVTVDPSTGHPDLSDREPATECQVRRLRRLALLPSLGEKREPVTEIVEQAEEGGLTEAGAYALIGRLRCAIAQQGRPSPEPPAGDGTCESCGQTNGPTSRRCGAARGSAAAEQTENTHDGPQWAQRTEDPKVHKRENRGKALKRRNFDHYRTPPNARGGTDSSTK